VKNQLVNPQLGIAYDAAGNLTAIGGFTFAYDAENRLVSSTLNSITTNYAYDGEGRRVKKGPVVMVYDAFGRLAAEYGGTADPVGTEYLTADHLGSTRLVTSSTGAERRCLDYLPFGEQMTQGMGGRGSCYASATEPRVKFTGKERDAETALDYFGARYFSGAQGRFTSPDPVHILKQKLLDPQQWNMYAYVRNNPLRFRDPTGKYICSGTEKECAAFEQTRQQALNSKNADIRRAGLAYGDPGKRNGVTVGFADKITSGKVDRGGTVQRTGTGIEANPADPSKVQATLLVTIQKGQIGNLGTIAHEGSHVADYQEFINSVNTGGIFDQRLNITHRATETRAYQLSIGISLSGNDPLNYGPCGVQRECKFTPGMMPALRDQLIQDLLNDPRQGYKDLDSVLYPEPFFRNQ
jgi:RHS repeat-associated protein